MNTIQESWESYRDRVVPKEACQAQVDDMEKVFYAGALSLIRIIDIISGEGVSEDAGVHILESLHQEMAEFMGMLRYDTSRPDS